MKVSKNGLLVGLTLAYIGWYFYYLGQYAINMPYIDDYDAILGYLLQFREADLTTKLQSLFLPHSEHIMVMTRLVSWLNYGLTANINFYWLVIIGNGLLVWQLLLLYRLFDSSNRLSPLYFFLVILVFLNPQYSATSFWTMALWSNIWVLLPVTLSIFFLSNPQKWYWALPFAIIALFGNGNGLMVWPVGIFILLIAKRPLFQYVVWVFMGSVFCGSYFYLMRQQPTTGVFELSNLPMLPLNTLAFLGAYFALVGGKLGQAMAVLGGVGILAVAFFAFKRFLKTKQRTDLILLSLLAFICLTALAVALFRAEKGMSIIIGGRYRQYSSLAVAISLLMGFRHIHFQANGWIRLLPWAMVGLITPLSFYRDIGLRRATEWRTVTDYYNILHNQLDVYTTDGTPRFGKTAKEAMRIGMYIAPGQYDLANQLKMATPSLFRGKQQILYTTEAKHDGATCGNYWQIEESRLELPTSPKEAIYLVLTNSNQNIIFPTASTRNNLLDMLYDKRYFKKGLEAEAYDCVQPLKGFQINWLKVGKKPVLYATNTTIFDQ